MEPLTINERKQAQRKHVLNTIADANMEVANTFLFHKRYGSGRPAKLVEGTNIKTRHGIVGMIVAGAGLRTGRDEYLILDAGSRLLTVDTLMIAEVL